MRRANLFTVTWFSKDNFRSTKHRITQNTLHRFTFRFIDHSCYRWVLRWSSRYRSGFIFRFYICWVFLSKKQLQQTVLLVLEIKIYVTLHVILTSFYSYSFWFLTSKGWFFYPVYDFWDFVMILFSMYSNAISATTWCQTKLFEVFSPQRRLSTFV